MPRTLAFLTLAISLLPATVGAQAPLSPQLPETSLARNGAEPSRQEGITRYIRFEYRGRISYGLMEGGQVRPIEGDLFRVHTGGGDPIPLERVRLLAPVEPSNVIAVGLNYQSHLGERTPAEYPGIFAKYPTSIVGPDADIVRPPDSRNLHYEAELVVVIGKTAKNVSVSEAADYIFGVTAGNDISERDWQGADLQWLRAKGSDTFHGSSPVSTTVTCFWRAG